jgi:large subunit ribosomal protein L22
MNTVIAQAKSVKISPRKVRLVADAIRAQSPAKAMITLQTVRQRAAGTLLKTLKSAMANAQNNAKADVENLVIREIQVTEGTAQKRFHPSSRGRVHPYKKRTSHIRIVLAEKGEAK